MKLLIDGKDWILFENIAIGKGSEFDEFFNKRIIGEFDE